MKILILVLLISTNVFALEAVITVLEAPMFREPNIDAFVVQYLRKGDVINIHPSIANTTDYDKYAPNPEKLAELRKRLRSRPEYKQDPLFKGEKENTFYIEDEFIPTVDRQGHRAYVLSDHIYVYFKDSRELKQEALATDPTDYRLQEPLPKKYPLTEPAGFRGQILFGFTQPYSESYPYLQNVKTKSYTSPLDANFTMLKEVSGDYDKRFFYGGSFHLRTYKNTFSFQDGRVAEEYSLKFGLGPTLSYDAYKGEKNRVNMSGSLMVDILDRLAIKQSDGNADERRLYTGISLGPRINLQYHRKEITDELDFVLGTTLEVNLPARYTAQDPGKNAAWWRGLGNDKFNTRTTYALGAYIGFQSAY